MNENQTITKEIWSPEDVEQYLKELPSGTWRKLPKNAYVTENFSWNEVLRTSARNIDMPSRQILENLKSTTEVLQNYRTESGKPITITSSWRTPSEQAKLIKEYYEAIKNDPDSKIAKPSATSLHMEGLAMDFIVSEVDPLVVYSDFDKSFLGELEKDSGYTHIALTTFSKGYLQRKGVYSDEIYRKLDLNGRSLTTNEHNYVAKRILATNHVSVPSNYSSEANTQKYKNFEQKVKSKLPKKGEKQKEIVKSTPKKKAMSINETMNQLLRDSRNDKEAQNQKKLASLFKGYSSNRYNSTNGHWITKDGNHIFIES